MPPRSCSSDRSLFVHRSYSSQTPFNTLQVGCPNSQLHGLTVYIISQSHQQRYPARGGKDREGGPRARRVPSLLFLLLAAARRLQSSAKHLPGWYFWTWLAQAGVSFPKCSPVTFSMKGQLLRREGKGERNASLSAGAKKYA